MNRPAKGEYRSAVYTNRPPYADYDAPRKFMAIQSIIAKRLVEHPKAICSYSGGSDSDIMIDLVERTRAGFDLPPVKYVFFNTGLEMKATKDHVKVQSEKYGIEIETVRPKINIVLAAKKYGIPFVSKIMSNGLEEWQKKGVPLTIADEYAEAEDKAAKRTELSERYPKCESLINFLCCCNRSGEPRPNIQLVINSSKYMLDFLKVCPPKFKISAKCCDYCKKQIAHKVQRDYEMVITGERRDEGGMRSVPRQGEANSAMCFAETSNGQWRLRPLYYVSDKDKAWYKDYYGIRYSDAYEVYGLKRTGCCGCPISYKAMDDLEKIRPYEPNVVKAAWNIFGQSYRYRQMYNAFKAERMAEEKVRKSQIDGQMQIMELEGREIGMIESKNTNELQGQYELTDLLPRDEGTGIPDGYDAEGHLLNLEYPPLQKPFPGGASSAREAETSSDPGKAGATFAQGHGCAHPNGGRLEGAQTPAPADRLTTLATEINAITEQTRGVVISAAIAVGRRLIEAKSLCPEGRFGEWLASSVNYSERKAQDMMRLYLEYGRDGSIPDSIAALDYSKAVALLSAPVEAREALAERTAGEDLSVRQLQQEIKALKAEKDAAQQTLVGVEYELNRSKRDMETVETERDAAKENLMAARKAVADSAEKIALANAKAAAAEASAEELRKLHSDAEDRAAKSAQRASDAVNRANQAAKDLAEARAKIQALSEAAAAAASNPPEVQTVEVVPEAVTRELEQLRRDLAEARASSNASPQVAATEASATDKFKWFYANQMKPTFTTALNLLKEVAREDGHAADAFATAITNACRVLMNQLGTGERD